MDKTEQWCFEPFRLDPTNACLWCNDQPIALRPKLLTLLSCLVSHAGQLVSKDELLKVAWPEAVVSDAVLKDCIGRLRRILGETARAPQFIATVHRQGYRFVAPVTTTATDHVRHDAAVAQLSALQPVSTLQDLSVTPPHLIAREAELSQLQQWYAQACQGTRQIVFVTGEAGIGKTTLVDAFVTQIATTASISIGRGQCIEQYGAGEAYLPLLEAFGQVGHGPDRERLIAIFDQYAPSWLLQLPALVPADTADVLRRRGGGSTQGRMLRELAEAIEALTAERCLLLILEDLHWSDTSTLTWLSYVARRRQRARLLVLITYRPEDAWAGAHPVHHISQELRRHGQGMSLALAYWSESDISAYLAQRFEKPKTSLPSGLVQMLHQRTNGNPLFLVTVANALVRQGTWFRNEAGRVLPAKLDIAAAGVPASLQHLIEHQLDQLPSDEQTLLETASVVGVVFGAATVAAGIADTVEKIEACCDRLARRGQFLRISSPELWPDGTVAARYSFVHALYQEVLYARVSMSRRARLHRQIGARLETGYGAEAQQIAAELATHFSLGLDTWRAIFYMRLAGENALRRSAYQEAIEHLARGLSLLHTLPETEERISHELAVLTVLGPALMGHKGYAAPEVEHTYFRARKLCQQLGETLQLFPALRGLWVFHLLRAELKMAHELSGQLLALAQSTQDAGRLLQAHHAVGQSALWYVELDAARVHLEQGIALYDLASDPSQTFVYGQDSGVICRSVLALTLWFQGYANQALQCANEAITLAEELAHPNSLAAAMNFAAWLHQFRRQPQEARQQAESLVSLARLQGLPFWEAAGLIWSGWAAVAQGNGTAGVMQLRQGLTAWQDTGATLAQPQYRALLAEAYRHVGQPERGLKLLTETLGMVAQTGDRIWEAELYRLRGELLLACKRDRLTEAESCLQEAIAIARRQQARSWELRAATSLARLWQQRDRRGEAYELLAPVYGWFTEGFDTQDLRDAQTLLDELQG